ncbi:hypothetical protein V6N13_059038 [Hibiscus sabdariffa]
MQEAQLHDLSDDADYAVSQQQILKEVEQMSSSFTEAFPTMQSWKLDCSNLGAEAISDVTSSSGPVKLEDLQRILCSIGPAEIAGDPDGGDFLFFAIFNGAL